MYIGKRLKELRKMQKMSLSELAQKSDVQIATLSRMEHLKMSGTLDSHIKIAAALGIDITQLYTDIIKEESKTEVHKAKTSTDVFVHSDKSSYEILTTKIMSKKMMPILLKIEEGGKTNAEQNNQGTEKFIFVLEGKIEVRITNSLTNKTESYSLSKNASLYFDASMKHEIVNVGKRLARTLCVGSPVTL